MWFYAKFACDKCLILVKFARDKSSDPAKFAREKCLNHAKYASEICSRSAQMKQSIDATLSRTLIKWPTRGVCEARRRRARVPAFHNAFFRSAVSSCDDQSSIPQSGARMMAGRISARKDHCEKPEGVGVARGWWPDPSRNQYHDKSIQQHYIRHRPH